MHRRATIPARINIIGEHTDYAGGKSLAFATDVHLILDAKSLATGFEGDPTVVELWQAAGGWPAHLSVTSSIPIGVGMSSSAALCLAVTLCVNGPMEPLAACKEAQRLEHEILKTPCGLLDQMAMMFGKEGSASLLDFTLLHSTTVPVPSDWMFKLVDSKIHRKLSQSSYSASVDSQQQTAHVDSENQRVERALNATARHLGPLLNASHASLQKRGVSLPEVDRQVEILQNTPGVIGARMMGGGFGGMILVLVESNDVLPELRTYSPSRGGFVEEIFE